LTPSQLDFLARCAVEGYRTKEIAAQLGCGEQTVRKYLEGGRSEHFDRVYAAYRQRALQSIVDHNFTLRDHLPRAYAVVGEQLGPDFKDKRLQWEVAKWLLENSRLTGHQPNQSINLNLGIQNNIAGEQVAVAFGDIGKQLGDLVGALQQRRTEGRDPHEKVGDEALPASYQLIQGDESGPGAKPNGSGHVVRTPPEGTPAEPEPEAEE